MKKMQEVISEIDYVVGMLIIPSMADPLIKKAMTKLTQASIDLGEIGEELEDSNG